MIAQVGDTIIDCYGNISKVLDIRNGFIICDNQSFPIEMLNEYLMNLKNLEEFVFTASLKELKEYNSELYKLDSTMRDAISLEIELTNSPNTELIKTRDLISRHWLKFYRLWAERKESCDHKYIDLGADSHSVVYECLKCGNIVHA